MRWTPEVRKWRRWFAWHPVWLQGRACWVWLEHVERKRQRDSVGETVWTYLPAEEQANVD